MPYIKQEDRKLYEAEIQTLVDKLINVFSEEPTLIANNRAGHLNYIFTKILQEFYLGLSKKLGTKMRYSDYNEIMGMLHCCMTEYYRTVIAKYEDEKIKENGEV